MESVQFIAKCGILATHVPLSTYPDDGGNVPPMTLEILIFLMFSRPDDVETLISLRFLALATTGVAPGKLGAFGSCGLSFYR